MSRVHSGSIRLLVPFLVTLGACALSHRPLGDVVTNDGSEIVVVDGTDRVDVPIADGMDAPDVLDVADVTDVPDVIDVPDVPVDTCSGLVCGTTCVSDPSIDVHHCGSCANDCTTLPNVSAGSVRCMAGTCDLNLSCNPGFGNCDGDPSNGCETSLITATNCGACGVTCSGGTPMCGSSSGSSVCVSGCVGTTPDRCGSTCTNRQTDVNNCGACGTICPAGANSTASCTTGVCSITCAAGFADCDGNAANGCEVDTRTDALRCGSCTFVCASAANSMPTCSASVCGLQCNAGFGNCDSNPTNGCEASLNDPASCGACGNSCPSPANSTRTCTSGTCGFTCNAGRRDCDANAANGCESTSATDVNNCGTCGNVCPGGTGVTPTCTAGVCGVMCASNYVPSGSTCVPAAGESCTMPAAVAVTISDGRTVVLTGSTVGHTSEVRGACNTFSGSADVAYAVTPSTSGSLSYRLSTLVGAAIVVRDGCPGTELSCDRTNAGIANGQVNVTAGTTYYFWVDSSGGEGNYALELSLDATCGNRQIDGGENCDDGNATSGDGCSATCQIEAGTRSDDCPTGTAAGLALGNGIEWLSGDTSTFGADLTSSCVSSGGPDAVFVVTPSVSGTLRATVYPERNATSHWDTQVYIRSDCTGSDLACANNTGVRGIESITTAVTAGTRYFVIVDGVASAAGPFRLSLEIPRCGDSILETGETCDDGNTTAGDGCDATCAVEATCRTNEVENNPFNMPNMVTSCAANDVFGAITPANDNDFFTLNLTAGQVLGARTFVGSPMACGSGVDTVLEIFRGPLGAAPPNNDCGGSGALVCNDDLYPGGSNLCSGFTYPVPATGQYVIRAYTYNYGATVPAYGVYLGVR